METSTQEALFDEDAEPPSSPHVRGGCGSTPRHPAWAHVSDADWQDWRWQGRNTIRTTAELATLLPFSETELRLLEGLEETTKLAIPPYYFSLIETDRPDDPIRLQSVPSVSELADSTVDREDPLEEEADSPVPGLTHRYPDRVLFVTTPVCSMYCRFCTRKRFTMDREGWDGPSRSELAALQYIRSHREIHDVIVSGGDPLMLPFAKLRWLLGVLSSIEHVDVIRVGSRVPVTMPQRLWDPELLPILRDARKVWVQTHFNHPREITWESARAIRMLIDAGIPVNNHSVLLKGVNDSVETMRDLVRGLLRIKARPYYLFHCDPVTGAGHFRTSVWKGMEIIEGLRGHVSGLAVPTYVVDGLHGAGKIPLMPNYLVSSSDQAVVLRNYEGMLFRYEPSDSAAPRRATSNGTGVSGLLSGAREVLMPTDNARMTRRVRRLGVVDGLGARDADDGGTFPEESHGVSEFARATGGGWEASS